MSQQAAAPPPPAPTSVPSPAGTRPAYAAPGAPTAYARPVQRRRVRTWLSGQIQGTPGRMRLVGALAALTAVVFGLVGAWTLWSSGQALGRAGDNTEQVVRIQAVYADLLRADADATNAFLVGGLEDPAQRADYEAAMRRVSATIALAAREQAADGAALAALNAAVADYVALVEQARAYNRQGLPVGATYQTQASDGLRAKAEPILQALLQAGTERAQGEFRSAAALPVLAVTGLVVLAVLGWAAVWLARRTHRYLNVGLSAAIATILAALIVGAVVLASIGADVRRVAANAFAGTLGLTSARTAAFDARANESLGLIARGQAGVKREPAWRAADARVSAGLGSLGPVTWHGGPGKAADLVTAWTAYQSAHAAVRKLDDAGTWDAAVTEATSAAKAPRTSFAAFEQASAKALDGFQSAMVADLRAPVTKAWITALALLVAGLAAAGLATRGISQRVEEYR